MAENAGRKGASFSAILGHEDAKVHLKAALSAGQLSHAYIIEGAAGIGKSLLADAFVKALLCENRRADGDSCGICPSCRRLDHRNYPDVRYIAPEEGKIGISVKQIREDLVADINVRPYLGRYKVYILEKADTLTPEAQNAMLKTIEEPPAYGLILLLAESSTSFLPTVISRCVKISLQLLPGEQVLQGLAQSGIHGEKARLAAVSAQGSLGRALMLCNDEEFEKLRQKLFDFLEKIPGSSLLDIMRGTSIWEEYDHWQELFFSLLLIWYHDVLLYQELEEAAEILCIDRAEGVRRSAAYYKKKTVLDIIDMAQDINKKLKGGVNKALAIDCLFMKLIQTEETS